MSVFCWHRIEIGPAGAAGATGAAAGGLGAAALAGLGLPVTVSNDVLTGALTLDAEVEVRMSEGAAADTFEVALIDLPDPTAELIRTVQATSPVNVTIHLGYLDDPVTMATGAGRVLVGRVVSVTSQVDGDGLTRTVLRGQEEAGYLLRSTPAAAGQPAAGDPLLFAATLAAGASVQLAQGSTLPGTLDSFTVRSGSTLDALRALADRAGVPLVVRDGTVLLGAAVGAPTDLAPVAFDPGSNLVALDTMNAEDTALPGTPPVRSAVTLTVLGHPGLRVGQVAAVTGLTGVPAGPLRLSTVVHRLTCRGGYTTRVELVAAGAGKPAQVTTGVQGVVNRWRDVVDRFADDHPAVDVGEVVSYTPGGAEHGGHLVGLHYGQQPAPEVDAPSVAAPVESTVDLHGKPVAAPFAFHRTGLMTPVYPGMRAVLAHNRGLVNDAVVAGFLWPDEPARQRPANQAGDWWLALPTGLGADGLPAGKGANDLTDAGGHRVVQVAGLHVLVGTDALPEVGTRPDPPDDASITIEHQSGTTITVDPAGAVTISTGGKAITLTNGSVSLALDGSAVAVS